MVEGMDYNYEVIFCIINAGFSDDVMEAAREFGARGGTVIGARGTANPEAEKLFGITVVPEKEVVMILVPSEIKNDILHALYKAVGLKTPGQGIAFSLPVDAAVGLASEFETKAKEEPEVKTEAKTEEKEETKETEDNSELPEK